jgi:hypothetical protein
MQVRDHNTPFPPSEASLTSRALWESSAHLLRAHVRFACGLLPALAPVPLRARRAVAYQGEGFRIERFALETLPDYYLTGSLFIPDKPAGRRAHASGVLGEHGSGTTSHFGLYGRVDIQLGTLSKALGVVGGYIAGSRLLKEWLINRARPYLFSTALPPAVVGALLKTVEILMTDPEPMRRLWENARYWKENLQRLGFDTMGSETPITPVFCGDEAIAQQMEVRLLEEGVFTLGIVYPTVPRGKARVRTMPNATHSRDDLDEALGAFEKVGKELGLLGRWV